MNPDQALYAFVDGELELADEQQLFDDLASHPELRTEMKDVLAIRNAVHRDVLFPSAAAETALMAATGLATPVGAAAVAGGSSLISRLLYAGGGILAGVLVAYFLFDVNGTSQTLQNQQAMLDDMARASQQLNIRAGVPPSEPARVETLYVRVPSVPSKNSQSPNDVPLVPPAVEPAVETVDHSDPEAASTTVAESTISQVPPRTLFASDVSALGRLLSERRTGTSSPLSPGSSELEASVRLRTLPSSMQGELRVPASVNDAILPNTAFAVLMPLSSNERIGVEFGLDAFHQTFTAVRNGRPVEVDQTPVLYWVGGTYEYSPSFEILIDGLRPLISGSVGYAFSQGPVMHSMFGLQYQPIGPVRFTAGFDLAGLAFRDRTNWFFSKKMGFTYGLSVDIGGIE